VRPPAPRARARPRACVRCVSARRGGAGCPLPPRGGAAGLRAGTEPRNLWSDEPRNLWGTEPRNLWGTEPRNLCCGAARRSPRRRRRPRRGRRTVRARPGRPAAAHRAAVGRARADQGAARRGQQRWGRRSWRCCSWCGAGAPERRKSWQGSLASTSSRRAARPSPSALTASHAAPPRGGLDRSSPPSLLLPLPMSLLYKGGRLPPCLCPS